MIKINLLSIGKGMPDWIAAGFNEYHKRLPQNLQCKLIELPPAPRSKNTEIKRAIASEGETLLAAVPKNNLIVALDERGTELTTQQLATKISNWHTERQDLSLLIGGADGLAEICKNQAHFTWSLAKLTLPHLLVRVVVIEQIYRAWTIISGHPYHRN